MNLFNPLAALFTIIASPVIEPPALDDTQEVTPIVLHTRPITNADVLLGYAGLVGCLCDYPVFQADNTWHLGHIEGVAMTNFGLQIYIQPNPAEGYSLLPTWRAVEDVELAWYDVAGE